LDCSNLPARFGHAGDEPFVRHVAEANAADAETAHVAARTTAQIAAILMRAENSGLALIRLVLATLLDLAIVF
jgi:hypothetical protein